MSEEPLDFNNNNIDSVHNNQNGNNNKDDDSDNTSIQNNNSVENNFKLAHTLRVHSPQTKQDNDETHTKCTQQNNSSPVKTSQKNDGYARRRKLPTPPNTEHNCNTLPGEKLRNNSKNYSKERTSSQDSLKNDSYAEDNLEEDEDRWATKWNWDTCDSNYRQLLQLCDPCTLINLEVSKKTEHLQLLL